MDQKQLEEVAFANIPHQTCPITGNEIVDAAIMHRDLSDWWPTKLHDMRNDKLDNLMIVERSSRDRYYEKLKQMKVMLAFSGGLDSTTVLFWCLQVFGSVNCLLFDYGQRHMIELDQADCILSGIGNPLTGSKNVRCLPGDDPIAGMPSLTWNVINMSLINEMAISALTRDDIQPARNTPIEEMASGDLPNTFVPGRNVYFLTALAQAAYGHGSRHVAMGVNVLDYSGYPDCRPEFIVAMRKALSIGVFNGHDLAVHAPLMHLDKKQIIRLGNELGVPFQDTHSCYNGVLGGCGECDSCLIRRNAFTELGEEDPSIAKHLS